MAFVLVGNYGAGNLGDEALKEFFLRHLPEGNWAVVSARPGPAELPRLPAGSRSFFSTRWWRTVRAIAASDGMVFGGGSLFTDAESSRACLLWWWHALVAFAFGKNVILAFQGIGPFRTRLGEWCARYVALRAVFLSVRDEASAARLRGWGIPPKRIVQSFDPVFLFFTFENPAPKQGRVLLLIPRQNSDDAFIRAAVDASVGSWSAIRILSLQPDHPGEQAICARLRSALPDASVVPVAGFSELVREVSAASQAVSARYHGALAALACGVECRVLPQEKGDKLSALESLCADLSARQRLLQSVGTGAEALRAVLKEYGSHR